jgi:hypothetical protein
MKYYYEELAIAAITYYSLILLHLMRKHSKLINRNPIKFNNIILKRTIVMQINR